MKFTRDELCKKYKSQRSGLYQKRSRLIKKLSSSLPKKEYKKIDKEILQLSTKIDKFKVKIFKCGKRYKKLIDERNRLNSRKYRLSRKLKETTDKKVKSGIYNELGLINDQIRDVKKLMGMDIVVEKGVIESTFTPSLGIFQESIPVWKLSEEINPALKDESFDTIDVNGEIFSLELSFSSVLFAIDQFIDEVHKTQSDRRTKTPMVNVIFDRDNKTIRLWIKD